MNEEQILKAVTNHCQDDTLIFQIIIQDTALHIYINRTGKNDINHEQIKNNIFSAISNLEIINIQTIYLYSRILGETEPDWEKTIDFDPENLDKNINSESSNIEIVNQETGFKTANALIEESKGETEKIETSLLSSYCFVRNNSLLTSEILPPKLNIAELIRSFHQFDQSTKENQLPILENYLQKLHHPDATNFNPELTTWWNGILELSSDESRKLAIWLSRYCFDPEATVLIIEAVFVAKSSIEAAEQELQLSIEPELSSETEYSDTPYYNHQNSQRSPSTKRSAKPKVNTSSKINKYLLIIGLIVTLSFVIADIRKPINVLPVICESISAENKAYCSLAAEMVGTETFEAVIEQLPEPLNEADSLLSESMMEKGTANCELNGNIAAGVPLREATSSNARSLSTSTKEILPDLYVADVEQTNLKAGNPTVRTACFFYKVKKISNSYDIKFMAMDQINVEWPKVAYEPTEKIKSIRSLNKSLRTYSFYSMLGLNTLFTAIVIYCIAVLGMAIRANSLATICQAAFILGITKSILSSMPILGGFFISIPIECIALSITSACVEGFEVDWNYGYPFVAATAMILIVSRSLLSLSFLGLLTIIFG